MLKINLCIDEDGFCGIDDYSNVDENSDNGYFLKFFNEDIDNWSVINDINEFVNELNIDELFVNEDSMKMFENVKIEFIDKIKNKKGKMYAWGIECDSNLMFVEE